MPRHFHKTMMNPHFSRENYKGRSTEVKIENFFKKILFFWKR